MPAADASPSTLASISIPWGERADAGTLALAPPADWSVADVVWPDLSGVLDDYLPALDAALDAPEGCPRLDTLVGTGSKVALVVDDPSRWTPVREALPRLLSRLQAAGVRPDDMAIVAGVGRHHALDDAAMRRRVGDAVADRHRCWSPPVDDRSAYADLGTTPDGVPVRVFRIVAEADLRILIGSVLPHLQAGFGGGYKLIFPGTSHRATLGALHRRGIRHDQGDVSQLLGGEARENPMRQAIRAAAERIGPCVSVSHLLGAPGQVLRVRVGHPDPVQDALAAEARQRFKAPDAPQSDLVVVGNHPWPGDPMQSFKALLQHRAACRKGGVLVGFFWTDPHELDRSIPLSVLRAIAATRGLGGWALRHGLTLVDRMARAVGSPSAFLVHWARELVVDRTVLVYAPALFDRLGPRLGPVHLFADQPSLWKAAALALPGVEHPRLRIFPQGGLTYAPATRAGHR
ncbi:MAG: hypothetical protein NVSMB9_06550 [Isosphaeraceae bacterium]